jgi:RNA polymerase sigma-70 factor (ECF subfamily)
MTTPQQERFLGELEAHKKILYKVARIYCGNPTDREDLMQETVIQLWCSFERFAGQSRFSTWMYRVALNVAISWVRTQHHARRTVSLDDEVLDTTLVDEASDDLPPEVGVFLKQLLNGLNELDRALILLYLEGHDHDTIADILGISSTNVATKIGRIKQKLQAQFNAA